MVLIIDISPKKTFFADFIFSSSRHMLRDCQEICFVRKSHEISMEVTPGNRV